jgi:hypothetical protein
MQLPFRFPSIFPLKIPSRFLPENAKPADHPFRAGFYLKIHLLEVLMVRAMVAVNNRLGISP